MASDVELLMLNPESVFENKTDEEDKFVLQGLVNDTIDNIIKLKNETMEEVDEECLDIENEMCFLHTYDTLPKQLRGEIWLSVKKNVFLLINDQLRKCCQP